MRSSEGLYNASNIIHHGDETKRLHFIIEGPWIVIRPSNSTVLDFWNRADSCDVCSKKNEALRSQTIFNIEPMSGTKSLYQYHSSSFIRHNGIH